MCCSKRTESAAHEGRQGAEDMSRRLARQEASVPPPHTHPFNGDGSASESESERTWPWGDTRPVAVQRLAVEWAVAVEVEWKVEREQEWEWLGRRTCIRVPPVTPAPVPDSNPASYPVTPKPKPTLKRLKTQTQTLETLHEKQIKRDEVEQHPHVLSACPLEFPLLHDPRALPSFMFTHPTSSRRPRGVVSLFDQYHEPFVRESVQLDEEQACAAQ
ncbi:hypothetical protein C8R43DRAFT_958807 [Mycena crocata]|nr:hypothetical protein C8R43DRAFT_958807 [Mycena crocata]